MEETGKSARRDALGQTCFWLHVAVLLFIVAGWALPGRGPMQRALGRRIGFGLGLRANNALRAATKVGRTRRG